jgi:hypothetical protein
MTAGDVGSLSLDHPRALVRARGRPAVLVALLGQTMVMPPPGVHFGVGLAGAGIAAGAAAALTLAGRRSVDGRAMLLGTAFSTMTALLAVHAMATPGVLIGPNGVIALAGGLGIPVGTALLALTALPALRRTRNVRPLMVLQVALGAAVLGLAAIALTFPSVVPKVPTAGSDAAYALLASGLSFCMLLIHRATRTFWLTRRPADLLVAVGCIWLGVALVAQLAIGPMTLGYYLGHGLELAAVAMIAIPAARDLARTGASFPLVGDLTTTDLVASGEAYLGPRVRGLTEEELPLHTRILTVCDVYDALVSDRVYRAAWTPERAFELLRDDAGSAFDERCVEALARVVGLAPAPGWVAEVAPAPLRTPGLPGSLRPTS